MTQFKFLARERGNHIIVRLFAGAPGAQLTLSGALLFTPHEWRNFEQYLMHSEDIGSTVTVEWDNGDEESLL